MKRTMFIFCGGVWFLFGLFVGVFSLRYLMGGVGSEGSIAMLQIFSPVSVGSILFGLIQLVGLLALTILSLAIGGSLFLHGLHPADREEPEQETQKKT